MCHDLGYTNTYKLGTWQLPDVWQHSVVLLLLLLALL